MISLSQGLPPADTNGLSDPYVVMYLSFSPKVSATNSIYDVQDMYVHKIIYIVNFTYIILYTQYAVHMYMSGIFSLALSTCIHAV